MEQIEEWMCCTCKKRENNKRKNLKTTLVAEIRGSVYRMSELSEAQKNDKNIEKYEAPCCRLCGDLLAPVLMMKTYYDEDGEQI